MSWEEISRPDYAAVRGEAVTVTLTNPSKTGLRRLCITAVPALMEGMTWWKAEARVRVMNGTGENAGMIRIEPDRNGVFALKSSRPTAKAPSAFVFIPLPDGLDVGVPRRSGVEFDYSDGWLELTLPSPVASPPAARPGMRATPAVELFRTTATIGPRGTAGGS